MHWRYDPLFSISAYHTRYANPDPDTGEAPRKAPDFSLEPSSTTAARLRNMGWIFKQKTGSCTIYGEKLFEPDGTTRLRCIPAPEEGLTFLLRLNNPAILNETKPYVLESIPDLIPNNNLPGFSGRSRLLYFDNRDPTPEAGSDELNLADGVVDEPQLASRAPRPFDLQNAPAGVTELVLTPLAPRSLPKTYTINLLTKSVVINLPENGYTLEYKPGTQKEILYLTSDSMPNDLLGIIRIFKPTGNTGWEPYQRYKLLFEKV